MDHTLEARWFYPGSPPDILVDWIRDLGAEVDSVRTDLYLVSTDPAMNVKLREGKVQTKHRLGPSTPISFGDRAQGYQERWVKWSFDLDDDPDLLDDDPTDLWVPVHKKRLQLEMDEDDQADRLDVLVEEEPTEAALELTTVSARGEEAWSVCIESEGRPEGLPGTLRQVGDFLLDDTLPHTFTSDRSFGYAAWIGQL